MSRSKSKSAETTRKTARLPRLKVVLEKREASEEANLNQQQLIELAEEYMKVRQNESVSYKTIEQTQHALLNFIAFNLDSESITQTLLRQWVQSLKDKNLARSTVKAWAVQVKRFFRWMQETGSISVNPWEGMSFAYGKQILKRELFSEDEYQLIKRKAYGTPWYYAAIVGWNTGLRMIDVANLRFEHVNYEQQFITCLPRKTKNRGIRVTIPFQSGTDISKLLYQLRGVPPDDSGYLCPVLQAMTHKDHGSYLATLEFNRWLRKTCKISDKTFHTFRRTFITRLMSNDVDSELAMSITGITDRETLSHYYVPNLKALKNAILKLNS